MVLWYFRINIVVFWYKISSAQITRENKRTVIKRKANKLTKGLVKKYRKGGGGEFG